LLVGIFTPAIRATKSPPRARASVLKLKQDLPI
jgi:hypothetical protein